MVNSNKQVCKHNRSNRGETTKFLTRQIKPLHLSKHIHKNNHTAIVQTGYNLLKSKPLSISQSARKGAVRDLIILCNKVKDTTQAIRGMPSMPIDANILPLSSTQSNCQPKSTQQRANPPFKSNCRILKIRTTNTLTISNNINPKSWTKMRFGTSISTKTTKMGVVIRIRRVSH